MRVAAVLVGVALCARAEEPPQAPGVTVEISAERTEFAIGDPILVDVVYRNEGKGTWEIWEPHVLQFYDVFEARDALGTKVPNPYDDVESDCYDGPVTIHKLAPGGTATVRRYVNESVAFEKPGEYVVAPRGEVWGPTPEGPWSDFRCASKPLKIKILPAPDRKTCDEAARDLKRLWCDPALRQREEYARYRPYITEDNGKTDALHILAFRRDQELLPFWLELVGNHDAAFAPEALAGLPDRPAVLKVIEERLARGERERYLWLYTCLAVPKTDDVEWKDVYARRSEIEKRYAGK